MTDPIYTSNVEMNFDGDNITRKSIFNQTIAALLEKVRSGEWLAIYNAKAGDLVFFPAAHAFDASFPQEEAWSASMIESFWAKKAACAACKFQAAEMNEVTKSLEVTCANLRSPFYKRFFDAATVMEHLGCAQGERVSQQQLEAGYLLYIWNEDRGCFEQSERSLLKADVTRTVRKMLSDDEFTDN